MRKLWLLSLLFLVACSGQPAPKSEEIICTLAYRQSIEVGIESEESFTLNAKETEKTVIFPDRLFHATYNLGEMDNEHNLRLWVTDLEDETTYHSTLYQLPQFDAVTNLFVGGHGFTGLHYSYAPNSPAELQYWCVAN